MERPKTIGEIVECISGLCLCEPKDISCLYWRTAGYAKEEKLESYNQVLAELIRSKKPHVSHNPYGDPYDGAYNMGIKNFEQALLADLEEK